MSNTPNYEVFVVGGNKQVEQMFIEEGWQVQGEFDKNTCDLIQFTGGADISAHIYGAMHTKNVRGPDVERDLRELGYYIKGLKSEIPMAGICRGAQLLCCLNGGMLFQNVDNHVGEHKAYCHTWDKEISVTSTHHQMMHLPFYLNKAGDDEVVILMDCAISTKRETDKAAFLGTRERSDLEAVLFPKPGVLCYQPHPEYRDKEDECRRQYFDLLAEWLYLNVA